MPGEDFVDETSMIFTEADVYMIAGYLGVQWGIDDVEEIVEATERAITSTLSQENNG